MKNYFLNYVNTPWQFIIQPFSPANTSQHRHNKDKRTESNYYQVNAQQRSYSYHNNLNTEREQHNAMAKRVTQKPAASKSKKTSTPKRGQIQKRQTRQQTQRQNTRAPTERHQRLPTARQITQQPTQRPTTRQPTQRQTTSRTIQRQQTQRRRQPILRRPRNPAPTRRSSLPVDLDAITSRTTGPRRADAMNSMYTSLWGRVSAQVMRTVSSQRLRDLNAPRNDLVDLRLLTSASSPSSNANRVHAIRRISSALAAVKSNLTLDTTGGRMLLVSTRGVALEGRRQRRKKEVASVKVSTKRKNPARHCKRGRGGDKA